MSEHSSLCQIAPAALLLFSFFAFFCVAIYRLAGWTYARFHALDEEANKVDTQLHSLQEEGRLFITPGADLGARMEEYVSPCLLCSTLADLTATASVLASSAFDLPVR